MWCVELRVRVGGTDSDRMEGQAENASCGRVNFSQEETMAVDFSCLLFVASGVVIFTMVCCSAPGCANHSDKSPDGVSFHSFPLSDPERLAKWLSLMRREDFIPRPSSSPRMPHTLGEIFAHAQLLNFKNRNS